MEHFGVTELRWFFECQFDRNARRVAWTRELRQRICGQPDLPRMPPSATLVLGINSSLLRRAGVRPDLPKPHGWDSYLGPLRFSGTADSVDLIMAASGEMRKMELRSLIEDVSRMHAAKRAPTSNPFRAPGPHQYIDIDLEAAYYMSCLGPVSADGRYKGELGKDVPLNAANGTTERRRCEALIGMLRWNAPGGRGLALPTTPPGFCSGPECAALDDVLGDRRLGRAKAPDVAELLFSGPADGARLLHNQALFDAVQAVPTSFELSAHYVRLLRYVARWAVAHRVWELCTGHAELLDRLPGGRGPVCNKTLPARAIDDNPI